MGAAILAGFFLAIFVLFHYGDRALRRVSLTGSLDESLKSMIAALSGVMRAYMALYAISIISGMGVILWMAARTFGLTAASWAIAAGALAFIVWSYRSGLRYLEREFGRHRDELRRALEDLERA